MNKKEELQKWLNDDRYVQRKELEIMWNLSRCGVSSFLEDFKVKPLKTFYMGSKGTFAFYDRQKCENARLSASNRLPMIIDIDNKNVLVSALQLKSLWNVSRSRVGSILFEFGIKPVKRFYTNSKKIACLYDRAECERARPFINQPKKEVKKVEKDQKIESTQLGGIFCGDIAIGKFAIASSASDVLILKKVAGDIICPVLSASTPDKNYDYIKKIIGKNICLVMIEDSEPDHKSVMYWLDLPGASPWIIPIKYGKNITEAHKNGVIIRELIEAGLDDKCKGFYAGSSRKAEIVSEPKEQTPDIIPADTIDLFTMSELESELKQRGVELTAEVKAKINASDMPEMQEIATMLRGNAKTIAIRLSVLNEIAGQLIYGVLKTSDENKKVKVSVVSKDEPEKDIYIDGELHPCPFCGGNLLSIIAEEVSDDSWLASIICCECGKDNNLTSKYDTYEHHYESAAYELIDKWNNRPAQAESTQDDSTKEIAADLLINQWNERPHNEDCAKTKAGAKSKYKPEFDKIAFDMASANKTDIEICKQLNISTETFYRYKKEIASFANALNSGRAANPFIITDSQGREKADRYFELKDFMEMQKQLNDMQKMIEKLVEKLDGVNMTEKKMFVKNGKIDKVVVTETKLEDKK